MASPIAGNESFTNVENVAGQLKVLDVNNLTSYNLTAENATVDPAAVYSDLAPTWEGLTPTAVASAGTATDNSLNTIAYNNGAAFTLTLPAATVGNVCVLVQSVVLSGSSDANTLTISAASGEVFTTGSIISSTDAGGVVEAAVSSANNNTLIYTPSATDDENIWNIGAILYFSCTVAGQWHVNDEQSTSLLPNTGGAWAFSTV